MQKMETQKKTCDMMSASNVSRGTSVPWSNTISGSKRDLSLGESPSMLKTMEALRVTPAAAT